MKRRSLFSANPVGWFVVGYSDELPLRGVVPLRYFGEPLLMFRASDGQAIVLGAHHWSFDGIAYHRKAPRTAVRTWPVCERNGLILIHFHPARGEPTWEIPSLPEYGSPEWTPYTTRRWTLRADVSQLMESAVAGAHLRNLNQPSISVAGADFRLRTRTEMTTPFGPVTGTLDIQSHGFGFSLVRFTGAVETLLVTTVTPIDEELVDARFTFSVKKLPDAAATARIVDGFVDELSRQVEADMRAREQRGRAQQMLAVEDAPAQALRGWAQQFYV